MDALDREILSQLQGDGRVSVTALADRVGLSLSACHRRIRELEASGVIDRYRAVIAPEKVGLDFEAIVFATLGRTDLETIAEFERAVAAVPNVIEAERLFGEPDYVLRVVCRNLSAYQALYDEVLGGLPGVQRVASTLVMKRIVSGRHLPL
ncbi:Lrp/AsnC family transcriptional regulator [Microbacterium sp. ABRD28]|uniref:Lrp/AsnC family transcriptional regulator n=1 Tax=Microbacterium sp. ABRD28 TaxID=2268461 RepID=UPI000F5598E1|nr:Lrp/AsnC family transcriptional regulator [Microbacterium sp. ABRD28]AZC13210.1 Lrp/AsnC family transcriptional regulator [Microbacterium sp. ABRD28]